MIRIADIFFALLGLIISLPIQLVVTIWVFIDIRSNPFFIQDRVGKNGATFKLIKFKSMVNGSEMNGQLTIGNRDPRITSSGYYLRKYKLDELPQIWNVLKGEMSMVGPRPELPYFTSQYQESHKIVFSVKPGLTDEASIYFRNEPEILAKKDDPEKYYFEHIIPHKIQLNLIFIQNTSVANYLRIIFKTIINYLITPNSQLN
jgi:lipopolysaccharide/colanic/teichoic acid biosynthesis glycosyltransferase